jgi:transcriptional regulator GlxA family with amidase domain
LETKIYWLCWRLLLHGLLSRQDVEKIQYFWERAGYYKRKNQRSFRMNRTRTIGIIVFDGVLTAEVIGPAEVFGMAGKEDWFKNTKVLLIGVESKSTIYTEEGIQLTVNATIADDLTLDVLLVPGGNDMSQLLQHEKLNAFIQKQEENADWIGSVCAGAFLLGKAGVLDGKQATTWFGGETRLQSQFPAIEVVHDKPVVLDHRRITANGGLVSYQAALVLLGQMSSAEHAWEIYNSLGLARLGTWSDMERMINSEKQN